VRKAFWAALFLGVGLAASAWGQSPTSANNRPRSTSFKPVSTTKNLAAPIAAQQSSGFGLGKFMPKMSLPSFLSSPKIGTGPLPAAGTVPQSKVKNPFQPVKPFTPNK
jgi:hypothetical protein